MDIHGIFDSVIKDPSLISTLDIEKLLDSVESEKTDYLEKKTTTSINDDIFKIIKMAGLNHDTMNRLIGYRYVDELHELHKGKHIRWIRKATAIPSLTNGGIVTDIKFLDNGTQVLCMNSQKRFIQYKFDECYTFQKLSMEEQLILMAYEYI